MSKIGKLPIDITQGVTVQIGQNEVKVAGPKGEQQFRIPRGILVKQEDTRLLVSMEDANNEDLRALFGLTRAMIANMVKGVVSEFEKKLELSGVGYRAQVQGQDLVLSVGFSHQVKIAPLPGIRFSVAENIITVTGVDKATVGDIAAKIRAVRPPEPYKGKGIKYVGERVRRKAGKAVKAVGGK